MIRFDSGDVRISVLDAGTLWLDGGAMFGVVPKTLWSRHRHPDEKNRIRLAMNVLLIEDGKSVTLVDNGAGTRWDAKQREIYGFVLRSPAEFLASAGLAPSDVDLVVDSHLHFDHAGGNTELDTAGRVVPAFPNARYVVQKGELEFARSNNERIRASYDRSHFDPIAEAGRFDLVEGDARIGTAIELLLAPGHTPFLQVPVVRTGEHIVAFLADLVPTSSHLPYSWIMGYDVEPLRTLESKKRILPRAAREGWRCVFEHDAELPLGRIEETDGKLRAVALQVEA